MLRRLSATRCCSPRRRSAEQNRAEMNTGNEERHDDEPRVRTRSRYSRFATTKICITHGRSSPLRRLGTDALEEDLVQRRLHQLEPLDRRAGVDEPAQQHLRVAPRRQLELEEVVLVVRLA